MYILLWLLNSRNKYCNYNVYTASNTFVAMDPRLFSSRGLKGTGVQIAA